MCGEGILYLFMKDRIEKLNDAKKIPMEILEVFAKKDAQNYLNKKLTEKTPAEDPSKAAGEGNMKKVKQVGTTAENSMTEAMNFSFETSMLTEEDLKAE